MLIRLDTVWLSGSKVKVVGKYSRPLEENKSSATAGLADCGGKTDLNWNRVSHVEIF